jgi:hypothetical protein
VVGVPASLRLRHPKKSREKCERKCCFLTARCVYFGGSPIILAATNDVGGVMTDSKKLLSEMARELGRRGGIARAKKLSADRRSEIARQAVMARWAKHRKGAK